MELPNKKYQIIYADPPWRYNFSNTNNRKIENQYQTMSLDEICKLNIHTDKNCILFLWATAPKLIEAITLIKSWGFEYKTHCIWDKEIIGMGYWFRGQHELLLVATKGKPNPPIQSIRESSIYKEKRTKHSKKPNHFRDFINKAYPNVLKIELFAREKFDGWDCYGNELSDTIQKRLIEDKTKW